MIFENWYNLLVNVMIVESKWRIYYASFCELRLGLIDSIAHKSFGMVLDFDEC